MLDETQPEGRLIASTMRLAAEKPWRDIALLDIAEAARVPLPEVRKLFPSKTAIITKFMRLADDATLASLPPRTTAAGQEALSPRDQLFEVIMTRFDVLAPYKEGLKSIQKAMLLEPEVLQRLFASQAWMLHGAGITTDGVQGRMKVTGLVSIYTQVFSTWLDDDDPGHAKTMAALDRRLRRAGDIYGTIDGFMTGANRIVRDLPGLFGQMADNVRKAMTPGSRNTTSNANDTTGPDQKAS
jgi:ubiquinone biosynthesis protein COQ9